MVLVSLSPLVFKNDIVILNFALFVNFNFNPLMTRHIPLVLKPIVKVLFELFLCLPLLLLI